MLFPSRILRLKCFPHRKAKCRFGLEIIQAPRIVQERQLGDDLGLPKIRDLRIQRFLPSRLRYRVEVWIRRSDLRIKPVEVVRVINAEGRLDDGKIDAELDTSRVSDAEVRSLINAESFRERSLRKG